ncbi:alpha-crystallin A chain-like [Uloborus diversus]|uniref:alpha-crystallin A chain-like n=1 Tax=Uloborus diversus TaxID=327109 RepID=UPI00240A989E|nr:alpha-crystallin A chain-like [Uloborus diversus]
MSLVRSHPLLSGILFDGGVDLDRHEYGFNPADVLRDLNFPNPNPMLVANVPEEPANQFKVMLYLRHFIPEKIQITISDKVITVRGEHNSRLDKHGFVMRSFEKTIPVPDDVDEAAISAMYYQNGVLVIRGPRVSEGVPASVIREVPIKLQAQTHMQTYVVKAVIVTEPRHPGLI